MDQDEIKGKVKDIGGRVERQVGEWTGDKDAQAEGAGDQIKGKVQNTWGKVKDEGRKAMDDIRRPDNRDVESDREIKRDDRKAG
jgi:uncharacterized protein YjbJ (UPF0337 family)